MFFDFLILSNFFKRCSYEIENNHNSTQTALCRIHCRGDCEHMIYKTSVSASQFPTITYKEVLIRNENISVNYDTQSPVSIELVKETVLSLNVYYRDNHYKEIREKAAIDESSIFSNSGGVIDAFLGILLLSFTEILEVIYEFLFFLWKLCTKKKKILKRRI